MVTMLFGFLMYLPQKDMKRLLAFSTIAQLSYVFFGLGVSVFGSQLALTVPCATSLTTLSPRPCSS